MHTEPKPLWVSLGSRRPQRDPIGEARACVSSEMELPCASLSSVLVCDTQERRLSCGTGTIHTDRSLLSKPEKRSRGKPGCAEPW